MALSYDVFTEAFLGKISEYDFPENMFDRNQIVDGFMKRAISEFEHICKYDLVTTADDLIREFSVDVAPKDLTELADIISEGMLVQWMRPYVYRTENLENVLNTRDFSTYSPAELLYRISDSYRDVRRQYTNMMREYSYNHGDLTDLHM